MFFFCGCACLSFSDLLAYGYAVMMLNVLRSDIIIKNSTVVPSIKKSKDVLIYENKTTNLGDVNIWNIVTKIICKIS